VFRDQVSIKDHLEMDDDTNMEMMIEVLSRKTVSTAEQAIGYAGDGCSLVAKESSVLQKGDASILLKFQPVDMSVWLMVREGLNLDRVEAICDALRENQNRESR
jgi:hypothetical protein